MKFAILVLICCILNSFIGSAVLAKGLPTIGVVGFTNRVAITNVDGSAVESFKIATEVLADGLVSCERLAVVDITSEVENFRMNELILQLDGQKTDMDIRRLGTDYLIFGYLTNLSIKVSEKGINNLKNLSVERTAETACANLSAKIVDTRTGRIVLTVTGKGETTNSKVDAKIDEHEIKVGITKVTEKCVLDAISIACDEIAKKILAAI